MVTDRYQHLMHHPDVDALIDWAADRNLEIVAVDNTPGSVPLETTTLPYHCLLLFGQEGPGVTERARQVASTTVSIAQFGSTRSINAGGRRGNRDARVDTSACGPDARVVTRAQSWGGAAIGSTLIVK